MAQDKGPAIGIIISRKGAPPDDGGPGGKRMAAPPPQDGGEPDADDMAGGPRIDPNWVNYMEAGHDCQHCGMNERGTCTLLKIPIGTTCQAFTPQHGEPDQDEQ